jgi:ubiquinone/menaquinone biosynthesis C-methylase UbiE
MTGISGLEVTPKNFNQATPCDPSERRLEMSAAHNRIENYVLVNSMREPERLKLRAKFLEKWTEQFLLSAGLEPGMRVLDLGCGMGDVSMFATRLVGPSGHVTGIDRDLVVIEKARERCRDESRGADLEFIHMELLKFHSERSFDAVVGRYVLFFQPDPVAAIAHAAKQVLPQGIVVFHELDLSRIRSYPEGTLFERTWSLSAQTERHAGVWVDLGLCLADLAARLPWPTIEAWAPVGGEPGRPAEAIRRARLMPPGMQMLSPGVPLELVV